MSVKVSCSCGTTLKVRDELAGKRVKCPKCKAVVQVAERKSIRVTCSCGQTANVKRSFAGKQVLCPECRQTIKVPGGAEQPPRAPDNGFESALSDALAAAPPPDLQPEVTGDYLNKAKIAPVRTLDKTKELKQKREGTGTQDWLVIVTAVISILFGVWHLLLFLRSVLQGGVAELVSLSGVLHSLDVGMVAVGIGLLVKQDWAKELGRVVAYSYLFMLGGTAIILIFSALFLAAMSAGVAGLVVLGISIPLLGINAIVPSLLLYVCRQD